MGQIHQAQIRARKTYWLGRVSSPQSFSIGLGMAVLSPGLLLWVPFWGYWGYYVARWPFKIAESMELDGVDPYHNLCSGCGLKKGELGFTYDWRDSLGGKHTTLMDKLDDYIFM